jgi:hypothetical protein
MSGGESKSNREKKNKKTFKKLLTSPTKYDIIKSSKGERNQKKKNLKKVKKTLDKLLNL